MYPCIVAPVDGSPFGEHALPLAASIAQRSGAVLRVAHVHVPLISPSGVESVAFRGSWNDITKRQEQDYLDALTQRLSDHYAIRTQSRLLEGPVASALEGYIRECGAGLVVMSTHAHTRFSRLWHHGVADHLARELPIPVLLVHPLREEESPDAVRLPEPRNILIPLDGTPYAESMIGHAVELGRTFRARYTLLRVVQPEMSIGYTLLAQEGHVHHRLTHEQTAALQYLNSIAERMRASGLQVRTRVITAENPAAGIVEFARTAAPPEGPIDLIALETHPHRTVARILGAHTADAILHDSPVPVLLFEPPLSAAGQQAETTLTASM